MEGIPYLAGPSILLRDCSSKNCTAGANWEGESGSEAEAPLLHFPHRQVFFFLFFFQLRPGREGTSSYLRSDYSRQTQIKLISITRLQPLFIKKQQSSVTARLSQD